MRDLMKRLPVFLCFQGVILAGTARASVLSDAAAALTADSNTTHWATLNTQGFNHALLGTDVFGVDNGHNTTDYSNDLTWDPVTEQVFYNGAGHLDPYKFIRYQSSNNTWAGITPLVDCMYAGDTYDGCFAHGYNNGQLDPASGLYYFWDSGNRVFPYDIATGIWKPTLYLPSGIPGAPGGAMGYFPQRNSFVFVYNGAVAEYNLLSGNIVQSFNKSMGPYHHVAVYNPKHRRLFFGGGNGSNSLYVMNEAGAVAQVTSTPVELNVGIVALACDPVTGDLLLFSSGRLDVLHFDPSNPQGNSWVAGPPLPVSYSQGYDQHVMATADSNHGVILVAVPHLFKVYLYKHVPRPSTLQVASERLRVPENTGSVSIAVTLTSPAAGTVQVDYGTGASTSDFTPISGTLVFNPGETSKSVSISIADDALAEADETFSFNLTNVQGGVPLAAASTVIKILDNDTSSVFLVSDNSDFNAAPGSVHLTATVAGGVGSPSRVDFFSNGALLGSDNDGSNGFAYDYSGIPAGLFRLTARVVMSNGAQSDSGPAWARVVPQGSLVNINFQPAGAPTPAGYLPDTGVSFGDRGNGFQYGWDPSNDLAGHIGQRNSPNSPDVRYDTVVKLKHYTPNTWQIALPNGDYQLTLVAGDPAKTNQRQYVLVQGKVFMDVTNTDQNMWSLQNGTVTVQNGRLTITSDDNLGGDFSICFLTLSPAGAPVSTLPSRVRRLRAR
jgi:hypothetical protein